ncbi:MAG: glycerol-3-phosphate 1-O-acyltransferase PlsY [Bacillota bacterium]|nr:glycerol-3-phosphate 1-O-acyltransferase PlsY [Bacillota bacterium]MDW7728875.1 glycerol-3-phosphate 1-O-acyltransferase PlsY [Bacillota bacterium]
MVVLILIAAYLLGSLPFGYLMSKLFLKTDIRNHGSGNIGATNVLRVAGWRAALPVFLLDLLKGFFAVILAKAVSDLSAVYLAAGFLAMIGHSFPVFLKFKGGKAAATAIGVLAALSGWALLILALCAVGIVYFTRYVSLGSIIGSILVPVIFLILGYDWQYVLFGVATALLVVYRHRENIDRLRKGTESKFGQKA